MPNPSIHSLAREIATELFNSGYLHSGKHARVTRIISDKLSPRLAELELDEKRLKMMIEKWKDCAEYGWTIIANAGGGDWEKETREWEAAAVKFRDENYYPCLNMIKDSAITAAMDKK